MATVKAKKSKKQKIIPKKEPDPLSDSEDSEPETEEPDSSEDSESDSDLDITAFCETVLETADSGEDPWEDEQPLRTFDYRDSQCLLVPVPGNGEPVDYFNMLLDDDILAYVCEQTNNAAVDLMCQPGVTHNSRITHWKDLTVKEMRIFVGIVLHTGTIQLHRLNDYWRIDRLFNVACFRHNMSRNRFLLILKCLSFARDGTDHYSKVQPLLEHYNSKINSIYTPGRHLTLDEAMVLWRGRLHSRQHLVRRRKYGMKIYMLTEPDGLVIKYHVHYGIAHQQQIALYMLEARLGRGHSVYLDKSYNSIDLTRALLERNTYCTGLLRHRRPNIPVRLLQASLKRGENISMFNDGLHVGKWKRRKDILYVSSEHGHSIVTYSSKNECKEKPTVLVKIQQYMSVVDRQEQMTSHYPCSRKTLRYTKKVFIHLLQICLFTSHKLYNRGAGKMSWYDFRLSVIGQLMHKMQFELKSGKLPTTHKLTKIEEKIEERKQLTPGKFNVKIRLKRKECKQCKKNKIRRQTTYHCLLCPDFPGLCPQCFADYHE